LLVQTAHAGTAAAPAATRLLDQSVAASTGNSAVSWQLILGQAARGWGDDAGARRHFQAAYQLAPTLTQTRYEWATALGTGSQTDAEQGVKLMDSVLDQFPSNPEYRSTRGQMLIRLGRNRDAAKDLEFAVAHLADAAELRLTLAKVYDTLGEAKLAQKQRQLAQSAGRGN
jgi:predicted Zn-dependent protease